MEEERTSINSAVVDFKSPYWRMLSQDDKRYSFTKSERLAEAQQLVKPNIVSEFRSIYNGSSTVQPEQMFRKQVLEKVKSKTESSNNNNCLQTPTNSRLEQQIGSDVDIATCLKAMQSPAIKLVAMLEWVSAMKVIDQTINIESAKEFLCDCGITETAVGLKSFREWNAVCEQVITESSSDVALSENVIGNSNGIALGIGKSSSQKGLDSSLAGPIDKENCENYARSTPIMKSYALPLTVPTARSAGTPAPQASKDQSSSRKIRSHRTAATSTEQQAQTQAQAFVSPMASNGGVDDIWRDVCSTEIKRAKSEMDSDEMITTPYAMKYCNYSPLPPPHVLLSTPEVSSTSYQQPKQRVYVTNSNSRTTDRENIQNIYSFQSADKIRLQDQDGDRQVGRAHSITSPSTIDSPSSSSINYISDESTVNLTMTPTIASTIALDLAHQQQHPVSQQYSNGGRTHSKSVSFDGFPTVLMLATPVASPVAAAVSASTKASALSPSSSSSPSSSPSPSPSPTPSPSPAPSADNTTAVVFHPSYSSPCPTPTLATAVAESDPSLVTNGRSNSFRPPRQLGHSCPSVASSSIADRVDNEHRSSSTFDKETYHSFASFSSTNNPKQSLRARLWRAFAYVFLCGAITSSSASDSASDSAAISPKKGSPIDIDSAIQSPLIEEAFVVDQQQQQQQQTDFCSEHTNTA